MDGKITPTQAMRLALSEARIGTGRVSPNPLVGCTILHPSGQLLAVGGHRLLGQDHAEIDALKKLAAPEMVRGSDIYVTLEPCAHQGRTPSCARTLAPLKPRSVTYAVRDPNPQVSGQGAEILRAAGVDVRLFSEREDVSREDRLSITEACEELAEIFLTNHRLRRPFVALKVAATLDGQVALKNGESKWITSPEAREHVHGLRARYDAVLVGVGTLLADDPSLNIRHKDFLGLRNAAVILDPSGRGLGKLPSNKLFDCRDASRVFWVTNAPSAQGATILPVAGSSLDLHDLLAQLQKHGVHSLIIEGGPVTWGHFLHAGLVDRLHLYQAGKLLGGKNAVGWASGFGFASLTETMELSQMKCESLGPDIYISAKPQTSRY